MLKLAGHYGSVEKLDPVRHGADLWAGVQGTPGDLGLHALWPVRECKAFDDMAARTRHTRAILTSMRSLDPDGRALGLAALMRITPDMGVIEVGHIAYSPALQRTPLGTEAQYLLAAYAFDTLHYRRYEWKCNALNLASRRAAERYGFTFEGIFRQHMVVKGKNRDTAWFSIIDREWPARKAAFERWLSPANFDADGPAEVASLD